MRRSSGIILPVYSLPSPHGIGSFGREAYEFVDFLSEAGQSWWQILPVGPTSYGDSPYQSPSTFAGNPYFVDLDELVRAGVLGKSEVERIEWGSDPAKVDYAALYRERMPLLGKACERAWPTDGPLVEAFAQKNRDWIYDYALFMAIKQHFCGASWMTWPDDIRLRQDDALERYGTELHREVRVQLYVQWLFFSQWQRLRDYAREAGIGIIGDLPIYVALDSADVWSEPRWFQLDADGHPSEVAGVPPDSFSEGGQLWGNPLYDYDAMASDGWGWWIRRLGGAARLYDLVRIDHFRGFASYWAVPEGNEDARYGRWAKGPGMDLVGPVTEWFRDCSLDFIAEDLGYPSLEVVRLLHDSGMPGMKVLEFAFDTRDASGSAFLPHNYDRHCVCYAATHDNETLMQWKDSAAPADVEFARRYFGITEEEGFNWGFIRGGMSSVADLFVAQMQDYLGLGAESRTNEPGTIGKNWMWRLLPGQATPALARHIAQVTKMYGRSAER